MKRKLYPLILFAGLSIGINLHAQNIDYSSVVNQYIQSKSKELGISNADYANLKTLSQIDTDQNGLTHLYLQQTFNGYPIQNGLMNVVLKDNEVKFSQIDFVDHVSSKVNTNNASIQASEIQGKVAQRLGFILQDAIVEGQLQENPNLPDGAYKVNTTAPELVYYKTEEGSLILSYQLNLNTKKGKDFQSLFLIVDANTGAILHQYNQLLTCEFPHDTFGNDDATLRRQYLNDNTSNENSVDQIENNQFFTDNAQYNVYALPVEAPSFGDRSLLVNPADTLASPFGWHDTNGIDGPEYTTTRGNNVVAIADQDSSGYETFYAGGTPSFTNVVDGGSTLTFNFPIDFNANTYSNKNAVITNLFYMNNMMHDIFYYYGFNEASGNFQETNYSGSGIGGDGVYAFGQTGKNIGNTDNATFYTPTDGNNPAMSMYLWTPPDLDTELFAINTAGALQGNYNAVIAQFGAGIPDPAITQDLVLIQSTGDVNANEGCFAASNAAQLSGKIAMIRRGNCNFVEKVKNAQNAGAVGVVMVDNVTGNLVNMAGEDDTITIPSVFITKADGDPIVTALTNNTTLNASVPKQGYVELYRDGSLDNGVMAHEFGHGISTRLTGGANTGGCLQNREQMGEGWSDYFALMTTMKTGDLGSDGRGIATYAISEGTNGVGIRPTVYSTDMSLNPSTYATLATYTETESAHRTGYVWATMLWDMTWLFVDKYGFSENIKTGTAGNNKALALVVQALKLQACSPGFVTGRNAILSADDLLNDGENKCEIWTAFARRGLGYSASQGSVYSRTDGTPAYDMPPTNVLNCENMQVNESALNQEFIIYPNPTSGVVNIISQTAVSELEVQVLDITGRMLSAETIKTNGKQATFSLKNKPSGMYVIKIVSPNGSEVKRIIKK